jgi:chromosome transmission fidelity protein 18
VPEHTPGALPPAAVVVGTHKRQFIKAKNLEVTEAVIRSATAGLKEAEASATSVLNDLFAPMSRKRAKDLGLTEEQESRYVNRLGRDVEASGALDKIALGKRKRPCYGRWLT